MKPLLCHGCPVLSLRKKNNNRPSCKSYNHAADQISTYRFKGEKTQTYSDTPTKDLGFANNYVSLINHHVQIQWL